MRSLQYRHGSPIVLTSLADKRAGYVSEAEYHQKRADQTVAVIAKTDAALSLCEKSAVRRAFGRIPVTSNGRDSPHGRWAPASLTRGPDDDGGSLNDKRRDGVLVRDGKRSGMIVFRIAQDGEGVVGPKQLA